MSRAVWGRGLECPVGLSGDVALEAPFDLAVGLSLGAAAFGVGAGCGVVAQPAEGDGVQCPARLAVTASVEPVADVCPDEAGMGAAPASIANAASERQRPGCDQAHNTVGPTPNRSSNSGCHSRTMVQISVSCDGASWARVSERRAGVRSAVAVAWLSRSRRASTRNRAAIRSISRVEWPRIVVT